MASLALFTVMLIAKALFQFYGLRNYSGDLAIFTQMFFHTSEGRFMYSSFEHGNHLGVHFSPILVVFIPLMNLVQSFLALMISNGLVLVAALALLYRHLGKTDKLLGLCAVILLSLHSTLYHDAHNNFHALSLISLPFAGIYIAFKEERFRPFVFWLIVLLSIRENLFLAAFSWGMIGLVLKRPKHWIWVPICLAGIHFLIANVWAPHFFEGGIRPGILDYFKAYGSTPGEIISNCFSDPLLPFRHLFAPDKGTYLLKILAPFLLIIPFMRWWWLPALPTLGVILLSSNGRLADPGLHFSVEIVWWFAISTIEFLRQHIPSMKAGGRKTLTIIACLNLIWLSYSIAELAPKIQKAYVHERYQVFHEFQGYIDQNASVAAPRYLANHLAWREHIHFLVEIESQDRWDEIDLLILEKKDWPRAPKDWSLTRKRGRYRIYEPLEAETARPGPR